MAEEYDLALGERWAKVVRDYLVNLGVGAKRVAITRFGKDAPCCHEESDACWSQNQRGHFLITAK